VAEKKSEWIMLSVGLVIGLFIALLVYLFVKSDDDVFVDRGQPQKRAPAGDQTRYESEYAPDGSVPRPRFEFYSILPELEVVVREEDALNDIPERPDSASAELALQRELAREEAERRARLEAELLARRQLGEQPTERDLYQPPAQPSREVASSYYLQTGSFQRRADADKRRGQLILMGMQVKVQPVNINGQQWFRVYAGPFRDRSALDAALDRLRAEQVEFMIVRARF
jgi:cell division protein FtsN